MDDEQKRFWNGGLVRIQSRNYRDHFETSRESGLQMNIFKTRFMTNPRTNLERKNLLGKVQKVNSYAYLGQEIILEKTNQELEVNHRLQLGWVASEKIPHVFC